MTISFWIVAEVLVASRLLRQQCHLRVEVLNPKGSCADFEVFRNDLRYFLHIKRLRVEGVTWDQLKISKRLRNLERIKRPLTILLSFWKDYSGGTCSKSSKTLLLS